MRGRDDADGVAGPRGPAGRDLEVPNLDALLRDAFLQGIASGGVVLATVPGRETQAHVYDEQGLLTQYLLRGLAGEADEGGDGLTFDDLNTYLNRFVVNLSEVAMPSPQRPLVVSVSPRDRVR